MFPCVQLLHGGLVACAPSGALAQFKCSFHHEDIPFLFLPLLIAFFSEVSLHLVSILGRNSSCGVRPRFFTVAYKALHSLLPSLPLAPYTSQLLSYTPVASCCTHLSCVLMGGPLSPSSFFVCHSVAGMPFFPWVLCRM